jgi:two-component system, chemotaxis family, protein-glutamate methylesterase/glutaminase
VTYELVCIGASWGGVAALTHLLEHLPDELDQPLAIVQHRAPSRSDGGLGEVLQHHSRRRVVDVVDKEPIERGRVYLAPADYHLLVEPGAFALSTEGSVSYARPSIDVLFESAADAYGEAAIGLILTGTNADGAAGLASIKARGGVAIVQDPATSERRSMPDAALAATAADAVLPLEEIPRFLYGLCCRV